ncbi:MAG: hypothetical protein EOO16_15095 [Chitinophagaceae bacterium]|nr:MAG: hypothetical protein EOO16_15095 [Chitinophagaceae bacterium]
MARFHKGRELNNVKETWEQNERNPDRGVQPEPVRNTAADEIQQTIQREAADYDRTSAEDNLLGGERATVNDDES